MSKVKSGDMYQYDLRALVMKMCPKHGVSSRNVAPLLARVFEVSLQVWNVQLPAKTTVLRILQEATLVARSQIRTVLADISGATLNSDGTTKFGSITPCWFHRKVGHIYWELNTWKMVAQLLWWNACWILWLKLPSKTARLSNIVWVWIVFTVGLKTKKLKESLHASKT